MFPALSGAQKDLLAALVALAGAAGVVLYAASSELFDLKLFRLDPTRMRWPREARIEHWYAGLAKRWFDFLFKGGWRYASTKKSARVGLKRGFRELRRLMRQRMPEEFRRMNRDMALGALVLLLMVVAFLLLKML
jgi:hypothetical protein